MCTCVQLRSVNPRQSFANGSFHLLRSRVGSKGKSERDVAFLTPSSVRQSNQMIICSPLPLSCPSLCEERRRMQRGSRELENNGYLPGIPSTNSRMRVKTPQNLVYW